MKKNNYSIGQLGVVLLFLLFSIKGLGQIAAWDFSDQSNLATFAATTFDSHLVSTSGASNITRGAGAAASSGGDSFRTLGFKNDGISTTNTDYFQVTLNAKEGYKLSLSTVDAQFAGTNAFCVFPGVSNQFAYSLDGINFTLIASPQVLIGTPSTLTQIDLTGITALQNVTAGTSVTLRYYASGQTTTGGWGFQSAATVGTNGLAIGGTVVPSGKVSNCTVCAWDNPNSWLPVGVPSSTDIVTIRSTDIVYNTSPGLVRTATTIVNGGFQIENNSWVDAGATGAVYFNYGTNGTLIFNANSSYDVNSNDLYWPYVDGPVNVKVLRGGFNLNSGTSRIINGTLETDAGITFGSGENLTINGTLILNQYSFFGANSAPTYGPASTLIYNTGSSYFNTSIEWNNGAYNSMLTGKSIPHHVIIQDSKVYMADACGLTGDLTIAGTTSELQLNTVFGKDLYLKGNFSNTGLLIPNNRAFFFVKSGTQTISSITPLTIPYVVLSPASGSSTVQLTAGTNLNISAPSGGNAVSFTNAADVFDINGQSLSIGTTGQPNVISGTGSFKGSATSNLTLLGNGSIGTMNITGGLNNFTINRQPNLIAAVLGTALTVSGELKLSNGILDLNNNQLSISATGSITNASASNYIIADKARGGSLRKNITALGSYTFPIGDAASSADGSQYSPATINLTAGTLSSGAYLVLNVEDKKEPNNEAPTDFISRYWNLNGGGVSSATYNFTANYLPADINGTETNSMSGRYVPTTWTLGDALNLNTLTVNGLTTATGAINLTADSNHFSAGSPLQNSTITIDKTSLVGFTYPFAQGPSATQSFLVNGTKLVGNITLTASANWEISTNLSYSGANTTPWTTIILTKSLAGAVTNKTIRVRLKEGLPVGTYNGTITLTSPFAVTKIITLSGEVTSGIRDIKVTGNGTSITNGSLTPLGLNNTLFASQNLGDSKTKPFEIKNLGGAPLTLGILTVSGVDASSFTILNGPAVGTILNHNESATFDLKFAPTTIGTKNAKISIVNDDPDDNPYVFAVRGGATYCSSTGEIIVARQDFELSPATPVMNYTLANFGTGANGPSTGFSSGKSLSTDAPKTNNLYSEGARGYRIQGDDSVSKEPHGLRFTFDHVDTSSYTNISLSFNVAGFSLGSASNGMDDFNASNVSTTIHADKIDYVLIEVSPDGGLTWYQQAKVVSGEEDLPWSFGSKGTIKGNRDYKADNDLTYFNSDVTKQYSEIIINNLPAVSNLKVRISAQNNSINESWILDDIRITSTGLVPKVWNGSTWLPSTPQSSDRAIINADYNSGTDGGFKVCQCEISSGTTLTVSQNTEIKVSDFIINNGNVLVESDGNFTQANETDTNSGTGTFKVLRKLNLSTARQQYNYISSPTENTNLKNIYKDAGGNPVTVPAILYHSEANNYFYNSSGDYIKGRALALKEPATSFLPITMNATFVGKPANGLFTYNLVNSNPLDPNNDRGFNLIGNPYPSNIDLIKFYADNSTAGNLSPTFYFWDHTANTQITQAGDSYLGQAYAQFNASTPTGVGTPTRATGDVGATGVKWPTRYVKVAQGFMSQVINVASLNVTFSNSLRKSDAAEGFFGKGAQTETPINRYWLNMITPENKASNIAVVYFEEGDNGFTKDDSRDMGGSDAIYSLVEGEKVSINGKGSFEITDKVSLGTKHFTAGNYTIAIDQTEGIFVSDQPIYLKDQQTGTVTNLTEGHYTFQTNAGETNARFEIVYKPEIVLVTDNQIKNGVVVYRDQDDFIIKTSKTITSVEVYDLSGKLMTLLKPNSKLAVLDASKIIAGIYVLKITTADGAIFNRKISK